MKKSLIIILSAIMLYSCSNNTQKAEFEKNTEIAKAYFNLHEEENAEAMFEYLHPDIEWHMHTNDLPGMPPGGIFCAGIAVRCA